MLTQDFSGVVIDQNIVPGPVDNYPTFGGYTNFFYQQFFLPSDYARGTTPSEKVYPDLSGFQILVTIPAGTANTANVNYTLDQFIFGSGWSNLAQGQTIGCHADGPQVWFDVIFPHSVAVLPGMVPVVAGTTQISDLLRIGVTSHDTSVTRIWFSQPNPLSFSNNTKAFGPDQVTPLLSTQGNQFSFNFRILGLVGDSGTDLFGNSYRSAIVSKKASNVSTTSGQNSGFYLSPPQPSPFAVVSNYFDIRDAAGNAVVTDSIRIDPQTPNPTVNVYYSNDPVGPGSDTPTWETLLWNYSTTFQVGQRTTFALPGPITSKFIKLEYTGLQAQTYNPGSFQSPVVYKKFPKWVADFFILQLEQPGFIANNVGVVYDALTFAYAYLLDDLQQLPDAPLPAPSSVSQQVNDFFNRADDVSDKVDPITLDKINLVLNTYQNPPGALGSPSTVLGNRANSIALSTTNYPVEAANRNLSIVDYSDVSSLNRDPLVFEQGYPALYFYLTCRHIYRQVSARFSHNRAYFVGINEVAFLRNNYTTKIDTPVYFESGNDTLNVDINDFSVSGGGVWTVPNHE